MASAPDHSNGAADHTAQQTQWDANDHTAQQTQWNTNDHTGNEAYNHNPQEYGSNDTGAAAYSQRDFATEQRHSHAPSTDYQYEAPTPQGDQFQHQAQQPYGDERVQYNEQANGYDHYQHPKQEMQEPGHVENGEYPTSGEVTPNAVQDYEARKGMSPMKWKLMHFSIAFASLLLGYDVSNLANVQIPIYDAFGRIELLAWVVAAYSLGNAAATPLMRRFMELFNLKWFYVVCMVICAIGGAVAGSAPNVSAIIVGRILMGVGVAGAYQSVLLYALLLGTPTEFSKMNGLIGMGFAIGLILGPVLGGAFAENQHATWRWASYLVVPWSLVVIAINVLCYPSIRPMHKGTLIQGLMQIDWVGGLLHIVTMVLFNTACIFSGSTWAWNSGASIAVWVIFGICLIVYGLQQTFCLLTTPERRIFPVAVITRRLGFLIFVVTGCASTAYGVTLYYLPLYFAFTRGDGPLQAATHMLPFLFLYIACSIVSSIILPKIRLYAGFYLVGGLLMTLGSGTMMVVNHNTSPSVVMGISVLIGVSIGLTFQLGAAVMAVGMPAELRRDTTITLTLAQYIPITMALAIAGCIFQNEGFNRVKAAIGDIGFSDQDIREALAGLRSPVLHSGDPALTARVVEAVTEVIILLFFMVIAAGCLVVLCSARMRWEVLTFKPSDEKREKVEESPERNGVSA